MGATSTVGMGGGWWSMKSILGGQVGSWGLLDDGSQGAFRQGTNMNINIHISS